MVVLSDGEVRGGVEVEVRHAPMLVEWLLSMTLPRGGAGVDVSHAAGAYTRQLFSST